MSLISPNQELKERFLTLEELRSGLIQTKCKKCGDTTVHQAMFQKFGSGKLVPWKYPTVSKIEKIRRCVVCGTDHTF